MDFCNQYRSMNDAVRPDSALAAETLAKIKGETPFRRPARRLRRAAALVAAAAVAVCCGVSALAVNVSDVYQMLYLVSPETAQFFMPINEACEDQGVRMEVVAVFVKDDTAGVYLTMQDVEDRLFGDNAPDLYDSYSLNYPVRAGQTCGCELVSYDVKSRTATYLLSITNMDGERFGNGKYTFSIGKLLTGRRVQDGIAVDWDLSDVPDSPPVERRQVNGLSYDPNVSSEPDIESDYDFLVPQGTLWQSEDGVFSLVAAGWREDGCLHLLAETKKSLTLDNHAMYTLYTADGSEAAYEYSATYLDEEHDTTYHEYVYRISPAEVSGCTMTADLYTADALTEGNWRVTFRLPEATNRFSVEGEKEEQDVTLFAGRGYTIYIPEEGWRLKRSEGADVWNSMVNDAVALRISRYDGLSASSACEEFVRSSGFAFEDVTGGSLDSPLCGWDAAGNVLEAAAEEKDGTAFVISWQYPAEAAEGFGARLAQMAKTFMING